MNNCKPVMPTALKWFLNHTFNDLYVIWFASKGKQLMFQIDDHTDQLMVDKIIGVIERHDIFSNWHTADYFFNTNELKAGDPIETMTLCLDGAEGATNFSEKVVIIQPFDNSIVHSDQIKVVPSKKKKTTASTNIADYEGLNN